MQTFIDHEPNKAGKHSVYLREDVFHCKWMLLIREKNVSVFLNLDLIIEEQIQAPEAANTLYKFSLIFFGIHSKARPIKYFSSKC